MSTIFTYSLPNENSTTLNLSKLTELMTFYPTLQETACWFNCSEDTIERLVKSETSLTFKDFRLKYSGKTRLLLKRKAISKALEENNDKMLIYCLKAMTDLNDRDKNRQNVQEPITIKLSYSDKDL